MRILTAFSYYVIGILLLTILVYAFTPLDNIDLKNRLSVDNATNISSNIFIQKIYTSCTGSNAIQTYANGTEYCGAVTGGSGETFNITYDAIAGNANTCSSGQVVNGFFINGSPKCITDLTTSGGTYNETYDSYKTNVS